MALPLKERLRALLLDTVKKPQLILEIDGLPPFGSVPSQKYALYGDAGLVYGLPGLVYGGLINDDRVYPYIDISKSTNQISQQLLSDKGGFSSTTNFEIAIVDKDQLISELISPGFVVDDILSKKAKVYLNLEGAAHPQESILFFNGIVTDVGANAGLIKINISNPEKLKNQELFSKHSTELTATLSSVATTIVVSDTSGFILPADAGTLRSYVRIGDELIEYTGKTDTTLTGCVRGQLNTVAASYDIGENVESFYRLTGNLRDLSLKLMLGGYSGTYYGPETISAFNTLGPITAANAVFISKYNIDEVIGVVNGDTATISGSTSNDGTYTILSVVNVDLGAYVVLDGTINTESPFGNISFTSKYNVLPPLASLGMNPDQVDIRQFERVYSQFSSQFFQYDFYLKDSINAAEFINTQILYPSGAYALPRKAKTSLGLTIPPLAQSGTKTLKELDIASAKSINIRRSTSKNFYNAVVYKYDPDSIEDRYLRGKIRQSADSTNRIKIANKPLTIEADGVRTSGNFDFIFNTQSRRFLDRYQFAAEFFDVDVLFGVGFDIEIGDTVIFDGRNLEVTDTTQGERIFQPRLFEVQNKSFSLTGKVVKLSLVDTVYSLDGRYSVIAPASIIDAGSTTTTLKLKESYSDDLFNSFPQTKWSTYVGDKVLIHDKNWTFQELVTLTGLNPANQYEVFIDPPLSILPPEGYIMDAPKYPSNTDAADQAIWKLAHASFNKQLVVASGVSATQFNVLPGDEVHVRPGAPIFIHSDDYSQKSARVKVDTVVGQLVTVTGALGFTPSPGHKIELLNFPDGGAPYLWL